MSSINAVGEVVSQPVQGQKLKFSTKGKGDFDKAFNNEIKKQQAVKFSGHALNRLVQRGINLSKNQMDKLQSAVEKAGLKGSRDSLVLLNELAFVVSVKDRTVVTALHTNSMKESIFTNIDSTVIA